MGSVTDQLDELTKTDDEKTVEDAGAGAIVARESVRNRRAFAQLRTAFAGRDKHGPVKTTGVRLQRQDGEVLDIYDDGSHRKPWKRKPGLSGRQFRKMRKKANRAYRAQQKAQETK